MSPDLIPALDPEPLPGPVWLFHFLLVLTFYLHLLFLSTALGGSLLAAVARLLAGAADDHRRLLAGRLTAINTFAISLTITTGVAPLLFVQVLYQQYFYSATILIGGAWLSLVVLLIVGYYAVYLYKLRGGTSLWLVVAAVMFLLIAAIQVTVNLTHAQPGRWAEIADHPWSALADATYGPRLLVFVLAGLVLSALLNAWWASRRGAAGDQVEVNQSLAAFAWSWALWPAVVLVGAGVVHWLLLPQEVRKGLLQGGAATLVPLVAALVLLVVLLAILVRGRSAPAMPGPATAALATMLALFAALAIVRHQVRALYLEPARSQLELVAAPQWGTFWLFAVLLVLGLALVAYMVRRVLGSARNQALSAGTS
jgi:hypothetical protein